MNIAVAANNHKAPGHNLAECLLIADTNLSVAVDSHNPGLSDLFKIPNFIEAGIAGGLGSIKPLIKGAGPGAVALGFGEAAAIGLGAAVIYNYVDWGIHNNAPFEAQQNDIHNTAVQECHQQFHDNSTGG